MGIFHSYVSLPEGKYIYVCVSIRLYSFIFSSDVHQPWYFPNKNPGISGLVSMANPHWKLYKNLPELRIFLRETPGNHHSKIIWGWFSMGFSMVFPWFSLGYFMMSCLFLGNLGHSPEIPSFRCSFHSLSGLVERTFSIEREDF